METKKWWKSKRVWGIITYAVAKILPLIVPESAPIADHIETVGTVIFGVGLANAKKPIGL